MTIILFLFISVQAFKPTQEN